jgi:hypothetical protein
VSHRFDVLAELDAEMVRVVESSRRPRRRGYRRGEHRPWPGRRARTPWRGARARLLVGAAAIALVLAGAAFAASRLIEPGAPVRPVVGVAVFPNTARSGEGLPIAASVRLLSLASADPGGGPAWGMRVFDTTRGVGCVQVGRLLDGELGVLGQDGAFADDGRFHALPLRQSWGFERCAPLDARGRLFMAASRVGVAASAYELGCTPPWNKPARGEQAQCPAGDERELDFGLLGPRALSVTYVVDGHSHTIPTVGPQGAYLIVSALRPGQLAGRTHPRPRPPGAVVFNPARGWPKVSVNAEQAQMRAMLPQPSGVWQILRGTPRQPVRKIVYRGGLTCTLTASGSDVDNAGKPCVPVGYVPVVEPLPSRAAVTSPVHVAIRRWRVVEPGRIVWFKHELTISFKARVAVDNVHASYGETVQLPASVPCGGGVLLGGIDRDVHAGETVTIERPMVGDYDSNLLSCPGAYRGTVYYELPTRFPPSGESAVVVGTFSLRVR